MKKSFGIKVFGNELNIISDSDEDSINEAVQYLNAKIDEISNSTKAISTIKILILSALNISDEFLKIKKGQMKFLAESDKRVKRLIDLIDESVKE